MPRAIYVHSLKTKATSKNAARNKYELDQMSHLRADFRSSCFHALKKARQQIKNGVNDPSGGGNSSNVRYLLSADNACIYIYLAIYNKDIPIIRQYSHTKVVQSVMNDVKRTLLRGASGKVSFIEHGTDGYVMYDVLIKR